MPPPTIKNIRLIFILIVLAAGNIIQSCNNKKSKPEIEIVDNPEQMNDKVSEIISISVSDMISNQFLLMDSATLSQPSAVGFIYEQKKNEPIWSNKENWLPAGDSLFGFIKNAMQWGLFPSNYHLNNLDSIRNLFMSDSLSKGPRRDAVLWANADILLTDAMVQIMNDIKLGRLRNDSVMKRRDSVLTNEFVMDKLQKILESESLSDVFTSLEPSHRKYHELKSGIKSFLDSASFKSYTIVPDRKKDSLNFKKLLQQRLYEGDFISFDSTAADSVQLAKAIKKFQQKQKIVADGKAGAETIRWLNTSDEAKFYRIAITLDRYKMLPDTMPEKYIWVNLPSYQLQLWDKDSLKIVSKVVVGKPHTRTPVLTSAVYEMITYPKWTIPNSIIVKDIIPAMKRNTGYLASKGFSLFDKNGEQINPDSVDWSKYSKGIPYNVVQGSGDANALGVLKFNFHNRYQVYLHDTNERYLFSRDMRSLSHGCVRVQEWGKLAYFFIANDSLSYKTNQTRIGSDSLTHWLNIKEKHTIPLKNKIPVFLRYFSCEGKNGTIIFYDDIYGEDVMLRKKYYSRK